MIGCKITSPRGTCPSWTGPAGDRVSIGFKTVVILAPRRFTVLSMSGSEGLKPAYNPIREPFYRRIT